MITRAQVADLCPGDVVELSWSEDGHSDVVRSIRGPVRADGYGYLYVGKMTVSGADGDVWGANVRTLTVVSRAPRPLYVNHPRTEPVPGDVVREEDPEGATTWLMDSFKTWQSADSTHEYARGFDWPLRLLVDGETGQVVP